MNRSKAFSLIELSIVILVIGVLIAGVTQGSRLIRQFKLSRARTVTNSSPVNSVQNLALWLETTMESSFNGSDPENNATVQNWYDTNTQQLVKYNATQSTSTKRPTYINNAINDLPALDFDGSNDDMVITSFSAGSNTSYFFVVRPDSASVQGIFDSAPNAPYVFRNLCDTPYYANCPNDGAFSWWNGSPTSTPQTMLGLTANKAYILYVDTKLSPTKVMNYYRNGALISTATDSDTTNTAWSNPKIGSINDTLVFYNGKIGEIIIFSRVLKSEERKSIESYLGKKWGIDVAS